MKKKGGTMNKLKGKIREQRKTYKQCADYLNISVSSFSDKINEIQDREFKKSEMLLLIKFLALTKEEANDIFFK